MRTATLADLRNRFPQVLAWLEQGEEVEIIRRGKPVACLVGPKTKAGPAIPKIDFAAQNKQIWGNRVFSLKEVEQMRAFELEGEEGLSRHQFSLRAELLQPPTPCFQAVE